jgi:oligoendopeptidase F
MKRLLALTLALCLLLTGCIPYRLWKKLTERDQSALEYAVNQAAESIAGAGEMPRFSELPYGSPDAQALREVFETARTLAEEGRDADELMDALDRAFEAYDEFYTLDAIAMIRADADQTDDYWAGEYERCERLLPQVDQWYEQMLRACAGSPKRRTLEFRGYFGYGELDYYEDNSDFSDELVGLMERESDLEAEFRTLGSDFDLDGEEMDLDEYLAREDLSEDEYAQGYTAYLRSVNAEASRIYAELIGVREQIAEAWGYDSYEEYCYDYWGRDYTPAEVDAYLEDIGRVLGPYYKTLYDGGEYDKISFPALSERDLMHELGEVMTSLGYPADEAFDYMERHELCDVRADLRKAAMSYTTYLYSYGAPYIFVDAYGDVEDLMYTAHEFGHFLAAYSQGYSDTSLDLDETYSQGMEYLTLPKLRDSLTNHRYQALLRIKLLDTLSTYAEEGAWASFEHAVYALPAEERTAERFNELSTECLRAFGCADEEQNVLWWTQIDHLFEMPFYLASYCVSVDSAMQLYELALEDPDKAWDTYRTLLDCWDLSFSDALAEAGLDSPFVPDRAEHAKMTIEAQLPK